MRRHRVFLLCTVGLCVISFLHYYKALHYVSLLRELSAPYPNIKSFIMVSGFFWKEKGLAATPLSPASPEEAPVLHHLDPKLGGGSVPLGGGGRGLDVERGLVERPGAPARHWENQVENEIGDLPKEVRYLVVHSTITCLRK